MNNPATQNYGNIKLMFDSMPHTCHLWNKDFQMIDCNDASMEMFKVENQEDFKRQFYLFSPEYQPDGNLSSERAPYYLSKAFSEGKCNFDWIHINSEGTPIPCNITAMRVEGKYEQFVVAHVIDMTRQNAMIEEVKRKDHLLHTVNTVAEILLRSTVEDYGENMYRCMGMMAHVMDVDRVYIWRNHEENGELHCTQIIEWSERAEPQQGNDYTVSIPYRDIPGCADILASGGCINGIVKEMTPDLIAQLSGQGILSIFLAPVFLQEVFWGFIGFDDCHNERGFSEDEAAILRSAGLLIANSMIKSDMTRDLKNALEEAQSANLAKSNFLSNMSHEIRTPMNAILGMGELLAHEPLNERQAGYVNDIIVSAKSLLGIINDILDLSKIESGKFELNPVDFSLHQLTDNITSMFTYVARKKDLDFVVEVATGLPDCLFGDDLRLKQALTNICGNAVKFTEKGHVKLTVKTSNENLIFTIEDTGIGIQKDDIQKLFDAFEQVNKSKNRNIVGTGLGLSISKLFIEMMGGTITVESEYGYGSAFIITLPIIHGDPEYIKKNEAAETEYSISAAEAKVLVVDDNEFNLRVASGLLGFMDIVADVAESGFKAIELVQQKDYDIVFMDHMMPEMDGVVTVHKIRELGGKYDKIIIVALTANAISGTREMFLKNGFNDFVSKPIDAKELQGTIKKYLPPEKITARVKDIRDKKSDLHHKSIVTFVKDNTNTYKNITDALANGDMKTAHRIAHTLKSSAGYLGKKALQEAAASMEDTLQQKSPHHTPEQLYKIKNELEAVLHEFEPIMKELENEKHEVIKINKEELAALLTEIKPLLENSDFAAEGYVEQLQSIVGLEGLAEQIDNYEFDSALITCNFILGELK